MSDNLWPEENTPLPVPLPPKAVQHTQAGPAPTLTTQDATLSVQSPREQLFQKILTTTYTTDMDPLGDVLLSPREQQESRNMPLQELIAQVIAAQALKGCTESQKMVFELGYPINKHQNTTPLTVQNFLNATVGGQSSDDTLTIDL